MPTIPDPQLPARRGGPRLRWGAIGSGLAASWFIGGLHAHTDQRVLAVASSHLERATGFAARHGIPRVHTSVDELLADDSVDIIYIATPNSTHAPLAERCLKAGRHVVVEKPFATSGVDADRVFTLARARGLLALDATWTRYQPKTAVVRQLIADGEIGVPLAVHASLGHASEPDPTRRQFQPALHGGVLFEMGVYGVDIAVRTLGLPVTSAAAGIVGPTGVDLEATVTMDLVGGTATAVASFLRTPLNTAVISGTDGTIEVASQFVLGDTVSVDGRRGRREWVDGSLLRSDGLAWQALYAADYVARGLSESPLHPHGETVATIGILETARRSLGVTTR